MNEEKYYSEIKELIENYEVNHRVRVFQDNGEKLKTNWMIGKLLIDAQGNGKRAKYGAELIKKWSFKLEKNYGKNYSKRNLMFYRKFYLLYPKVNALSTQLSWTHYRMILSIKNENEHNYFTNQAILNHLSTRELEELIKSKAYDRLSYADKENIKLIDVNNSTSLTIEDMIKDPILIKANSNINKLSEKALHKLLWQCLKINF